MQVTVKVMLSGFSLSRYILYVKNVKYFKLAGKIIKISRRYCSALCLTGVFAALCHVRAPLSATKQTLFYIFFFPPDHIEQRKNARVKTCTTFEGNSGFSQDRNYLLCILLTREESFRNKSNINFDTAYQKTILIRYLSLYLCNWHMRIVSLKIPI